MIGRRMALARSSATKLTYSSGFRAYLRACQEMGMSENPVDEAKLMAFCAYAHEKWNLRVSTLKGYVAAVCYQEKLAGKTDPKGEGRMLQLLLSGCARLEVSDGLGTKRAHAVTHKTLDELIRALDLRKFTELRLATFMALAYFGAFRASELVATRANGVRATWSDVALAFAPGTNRQAHFMFQQKISKTKQLGPAVQIPICVTGKRTCPWRLLSAYRVSLPETSRALRSPLFCDMDGSAYTYRAVMRDMKTLLQRCGFDPQGYSTHSFRVGMTTDAAMAGMSETEIKLMGRWSSEAFRVYIRTDPRVLANLTAGLAKD